MKDKEEIIINEEEIKYQNKVWIQKHFEFGGKIRLPKNIKPIIIEKQEVK